MPTHHGHHPQLILLQVLLVESSRCLILTLKVLVIHETGVMTHTGITLRQW